MQRKAKQSSQVENSKPENQSLTSPPPTESEVDIGVRRSGRHRHAPVAKFQDMEVTLRPSKGSTAKQTQKQDIAASGRCTSAPSEKPQSSTSTEGDLNQSQASKKRKRSRSNLWLNRPKKRIQISQDTAQTVDSDDTEAGVHPEQEQSIIDEEPETSDNLSGTRPSTQDNSQASEDVIEPIAVEASATELFTGVQVTESEEKMADTVTVLEEVTEALDQVDEDVDSAKSEGLANVLTIGDVAEERECSPVHILTVAPSATSASSDNDKGDKDGSILRKTLEEAVQIRNDCNPKTLHKPPRPVDTVTQKKSPTISLKEVPPEKFAIPLPVHNPLPDLIIKVEADRHVSTSQVNEASKTQTDPHSAVGSRIVEVAGDQKQAMVMALGSEDPHTLVLSVDPSDVNAEKDLQVLSQVAGVLPEQGTVQLMLVESEEASAITEAAQASNTPRQLDTDNNKETIAGGVRTCIPEPRHHGRQQQDNLVELKDGMYNCKQCNYITDKRGNWYKHRLMHVGTRRYPCPQCSYKAMTSSNLRRHMLVHTDIKNFVCDLCSMAFRQKIHLIRHIEYKHLEKSVQCPLCEYTCANTNPGLITHMKRKHKADTVLDNLNGKVSKAVIDKLSTSLTNAGPKKFKCLECDFGPASKKDLQQHKKFHKKGPELKFFCEQCSFVTDCHSRLARHSLVHTKEKPYACGECHQRFSQKEHVIRHLKAKHGIEVAEADIKRRRVSTKSQEPEDTGKSTHGPTELEIPQGDTFRRKYKTADFCTQEKHFACNFCTMKFTKLINLHKHVHIQHKDLYKVEEGQFYCVVCNYTTPNRKNLLVHMRKHSFPSASSSQKQGQVVTYAYSCVVCDFASEVKDKVYAHMKQEHNMYLVKGDHVVKFTGGDGKEAVVSDTTKNTVANNDDDDDEDDSEIVDDDDDEDEAEEREKHGSKVTEVIDLPPPSVINLPQNAEVLSASPSISNVYGGSSTLLTAGGSAKTVLVQLTPGGPLTSVQIDPPQNTELNIQDIVQSENVGLVDLVDAQEIVNSVMGNEETSEETITTNAQTVISVDGNSGETLSKLQIGGSTAAEGSSSDESKVQLSQLSRGDYIQINGEVYTVELAEGE